MQRDSENKPESTDSAASTSLTICNTVSQANHADLRHPEVRPGVSGQIGLNPSPLFSTYDAHAETCEVSGGLPLPEGGVSPGEAPGRVCVYGCEAHGAQAQLDLPLGDQRPVLREAIHGAGSPGRYVARAPCIPVRPSWSVVDLHRGRTIAEHASEADALGEARTLNLSDPQRRPLGRVYVASSWRNIIQPAIVEALRLVGREVYDFRHPSPDSSGFSWSEIDPDWKDWTPAAYRKALAHPIAKAGYAHDIAALRGCEACVLVLPSGRSASWELGYAMGQGKRGVVVQLGKVEPELMYREAEIVTSMAELFAAFGGASQDIERAAEIERVAERAYGRRAGA